MFELALTMCDNCSSAIIRYNDASIVPKKNPLPDYQNNKREAKESIEITVQFVYKDNNFIGKQNGNIS